MRILQLVLFLSITLIHLSALATPWHEASSFAPVGKKVEHLLKQHKPSKILLVLDIDNTLLAMNEPLGSDQWFGWQTQLLQTPMHEMEQVASSFSSLLDIQKELFEWGSMRPTDPNAPKILEKLQKRGIATLVLTSRGPVLRKVTHRELKSNGYDFSSTAPQPRFKEEWLPTNGKNSLALSPKEERAFGMDSPRPVSYSEGIFLTSGQHKGAMLRVLLHDLKLDHAFNAIVFVDDHKRHVTRMLEAFKLIPDIQVTAFHFMGEKSNVDSFNKSDKKEVHRAFKAFQKK